MTWTDYKPPVLMVDAGDGVDRPVRGLGLEDFSQLIVSHLDDLMNMTTLYIQSQKDVFAATNMTEVVMLAVRDFPKMVTEVISMATDTPELRNVRLPAGVQFKIIEATVRLTMEDAGGLGNLSAMLQNAVQAAVAGRGEVSRKLQDILSQSSTTVVAKTRTS